MAWALNSQKEGRMPSQAQGSITLHTLVNLQAINLKSWLKNAFANCNDVTGFNVKVTGDAT